MLGESLLGGLPNKIGDVIGATVRASDTASALEGWLRSVGPLLQGIRDDLAAMRGTTESQDRHLAEIQQTLVDVDRSLSGLEARLSQLAGDVDEVTDLLPDPRKGPMARLKDTLTSTPED